LTYKSSLLVLALGILSTFAIWNNNNNAILAYGQQEQAAPTTATTGTPSATTIPTIKITSPTKGQQVSPGELTITGSSSDDASSDCTVYTDWNDLKPMQKVSASGSGGTDDYSTWTFTYSEDYHLITEGVNELTSKISCENSPSNNITKSYSVNVTGIGTGQGQQQQQEQPTSASEEGEGETTTATESSELTANEDDNTPFTLPLPSENPDIDNDQSLESQEEGGEGRGGVTTNEQDNDNVNPNDDDDEPTVYWDID
jgi:hypothetical protein